MSGIAKQLVIIVMRVVQNQYAALLQVLLIVSSIPSGKNANQAHAGGGSTPVTRPVQKIPMRLVEEMRSWNVRRQIAK